MSELSHVDQEGKARMVDVTLKDITVREAVASGRVRMDTATLKLIREGNIEKGAVLETARVAGIMGVKNTAYLIPMCHQLLISGIDIDFQYLDDETIEIKATTRTTGKTGVEMEALTGVSIAALTIYDMCKAIDKKMVIEDIKLLKKSGGKSGTFIRSKGTVLSVCRSEKRGTAKEDIGVCRVVEGFGLEGDAHGGDWHRQVSLLCKESIDKIRDKNGKRVKFNYGDLAQNITTEGIILYELPIGTGLRIGTDVELEITQIGKEEEHAYDLDKRFGSNIMLKEAVFTRVIRGGIIKSGDSISVIKYK
jgi:cyclic pyranopterin monophosphate synthase